MCICAESLAQFCKWNLKGPTMMVHLHLQHKGLWNWQLLSQNQLLSPRIECDIIYMDVHLNLYDNESETWGRFHQHFKRDFCAKKIQCRNVSREKLRKALSYKKFWHKKLMKAKPGVNLNQRSTYSFCARRSQKRKKILRIWLNSYAFGSYDRKSCM